MTWPQDPRRVADPFGERAPLALRRSFDVLGARVEFLSDSAALMALAEAAYRDLPAEGSPQVQVQVELRMAAGDAAFDGSRRDRRCWAVPAWWARRWMRTTMCW